MRRTPMPAGTAVPRVDYADLSAEINRLRAVIRVNALRWAPHMTHAEIDAIIQSKPEKMP